MNALFGRVIKVFLTLVQADNTMGQDDGHSADWRHLRWSRRALNLVLVHIGLYRPAMLPSQLSQ